MIKHRPRPTRLQQLCAVLERHRPAFRQERSYWRAVGLGIGEKPGWNPHATLAAVHGSGWVNALVLFAAYRTWGRLGGPPVPTRWSVNILWRQ